MNLFLKRSLVFSAGLLLFGVGAFSIRALDAYDRNTIAIVTLANARDHLQKGNTAEAIFLSGSAAALSSKTFVLLSAGDILLEANEPHLARNLLTQAMSTVDKEDPGLKQAITRSLDATSRMITNE